MLRFRGEEVSDLLDAQAQGEMRGESDMQAQPAVRVAVVRQGKQATPRSALQ